MHKLILLLLLGSTVFFTACRNKNANNTKKNESDSVAFKPGISERNFGRFEGKPVTEYTLTNSSGMQVSVINYGGTITRILVPDKNNGYGDVVLGFDSLSGYLQKGNPYFSSLVGRR